jgi:hypothetical protein
MPATSGPPRSTDVSAPIRLVRFVPTPEVAASFEHFVDPGEQRCWEGQTEPLGGFQVDNKCNFCHLLNWQVGRSGALENLAGVVSENLV